MAVFTFPIDQNRLRAIFNLDRSQLCFGSVLHSLMRDAEEFDQQESQTTVDQILALMAELDTPTTGLLAQLKGRSESMSSLSVSGEYSVSYGPGGNSATLKSTVEEVRSQLRLLLDPHHQLAKYRMGSRVIPN